MSEQDPRQQELVDWLKSQGHSDLEIMRILKKVAHYDTQTTHESVFDSIDSGGFDIGNIIEEALSDDSPSS